MVKPHDLDWKRFIHDGIQKDGSIDAPGFSKPFTRNSEKGEMAGIYQDGVKGWQGTGMTTKTLQFKTISLITI